MIGLVLVTHGNLALEFISAMQHVVGKQEQVAAVCIGPEDVDVIDIKYQVSIGIFAEEQIYCFSALIMYKEAQ